MRHRSFAVVLVLLFPIGFAVARPVADWPYKNLVREADLVVLAAPESSADSEDPPAKEGWEANCVGVNTTLRVLAPLKGEVQGKLTLFHYRLKPDLAYVNGPFLTTFRVPARAEEGGPCYLLFLKKKADGRYEPVAGQLDSVLSIRAVPGPWGNQPADGK